MSRAGDFFEALATLPDEMPCKLIVGDGSYTLGQLKRALAVEGVLEIGTAQAAARWGRSPETWAALARNGVLEGAYQDGDGGPWRIPLQSCEQYVNRKKRQWRERGPRAQTPRAGTKSLPSRKVLPGRHAALGRRSLDDAKPRGPRLADAGRTDGPT